MYSHLDLMEKDMLDSHINFLPLKRFTYMSLVLSKQKLMTVAIMHNHCWITCDNSCASLGDTIRTVFGVSVTKCQGITLLHVLR